MPDSTKVTCGKWMPRKQVNCARGPGHPPPCATPDAMQRQRDRGTAARPYRVYDPDAARGWRSKHRLTRYGLTQKTFDAMLEAQGHACAMCRELFGDGVVFVDHDHSLGCHPGEKQACDRCRRGLLCLYCNTGLGYVERLGQIARAYLIGFPASRGG